MKRVTKTLSALAACFTLAVLLTTCNGGGGTASGDNPPSPPPPPTSQDYVVFAWNDLGMHCLNPTYDHAVILPPYNTVWAQVIRRGNKPQVVTSGITVEYRILDNTRSYGKVSPNNWNFSQFWDNMSTLFNTTRAHDKGLNLVNSSIENGLSGSMVLATDHFQVNGIPVTPINDSDLATENPYQIAEISVKNAAGALVAQTRATVPTSFEINCGLCHKDDDPNPLIDVIKKHNAAGHRDTAGNPITLSTNAPVLCASCHGSPALGMAGPGSSGKYLSQAMHQFHAAKKSPTNADIACYNCHPGATAKCNRSLRHTNTDGNCTTCHGTIAEVASSITNGSRVPWVSQKSTCATCHNVGGMIAQVDTAGVLYRDAKGHGGVSCAACHGSPHAMIPSSQGSDNYQAHQYQGQLHGARDSEKSMGSCGVCHGNSRPGSVSEWAEEHGSETTSACNVCHTGFSSNLANTNLWPHHFEWKSR